MSLRQVLTIYNAERQLTDDETALLNTLRKMSDAERGMFVEGLSDKPQKKTTKKSNKGASKSPRASSLQAQIQGRGQVSSGARCHALLPGGGICYEIESSPLHSENGGYAGYHPFVSPSSAPRAAGKSSSANGSQNESNPSSKIEKEDVSVAVGG